MIFGLRAASILTLLMMCLLGSAVGARELDRGALKKGMTLPEVVQAFGQPVRMEWVNANGQAVLFVFYDTAGRDVLKQADGRTVLPMGFVTERLAGWGKKFYKQLKPSQ
jgi:hypothetical protein